MNNSNKHDTQSLQEKTFEQVLTFCNHYLTLKSLHLPIPDTNNKQSGQTKKNKRHKFEVIPNKNVSDEGSETTDMKKKAKKRKFEAPIKDNNLASDIVPLQSLLSNLQKKSPHVDNNFMSFGTSKISYNSNIPSQIHNYNTSHGNMNKEYQWTTKDYNNSSSPIRLNPSRSEYVFETPINHPEIGYYVPRSRSPLGNSHSMSNLSVSPINKMNETSVGKKKRKGERSFYLPVTNIQKSNISVSQCTSTNNIIAKLEREIAEEQQSGRKELREFGDRSKMLEIKNKKDTGNRETNNSSFAHLDNGIGESLSFLSEARMPAKLINIKM